MSDLDRKTVDARSKPRGLPGNGALLLSAGTLAGNEVCNRYDEKLGHIKDLVLDVGSGKIRYAVMSCGGFLGMGDRLFAIPWRALDLDVDRQCFLLDVGIDRLKAAPGFDKDHWPNMADEQWASKVRHHFRKIEEEPRPVI